MIEGLPVTLSLLYLSPSCIVFMPLKKLPSFILTLAVGCFYTTPHEKASGFRNQRNFCLSNPKSRKFLILDSGIVCIEIRKTAQGIWIPSNDCNPESKLSCTDEVWNPVPGIPESGTTWILESKPVLDSLTWGEFSMLVNILFTFRGLPYCGKQHKLRKDYKKLAVSCGTKREICMETLLACVCWRLGCKNISLAMWWQGTDGNNNKGWEIYFWRIHQ